MALDKAQRKIINSLIDKPQTIRQLAISTNTSESYLRIQLKIMERAKEITLDKDRQPYVYNVAPESPELKARRNIDRAKAQLKGEADASSAVKPFKNLKKETWIELAETYETIARAVREMDADGELIDTL